ncbi:MAG: helix-turn-helix domain-containing protein [Nitrososphaeraceae archaeon]
MIKTKVSNRQVERDKALESGPFERLFSGVAIARMLDFLITASVSKDWDYSETQIAKNSGVSARTVQREISKLLEAKLVRQVRTVGNAKMYQLNKSYRTALSAEKFAFELARENIHKQIGVAAPKQTTAPRL